METDNEAPHRLGRWSPVEGESEEEATLRSGHFDFYGTIVFDGTIDFDGSIIFYGTVGSLGLIGRIGTKQEGSVL